MPASAEHHHSAPISHLGLCFLCVVALALGFFHSGASAARVVPLGSKLLPTAPAGWVSSPNESFRVSFFAVAPGRFSVGVLYNDAGINDTVAWTAGGAGTQVGGSASFELLADGNLVLRNGSTTTSTLWNSSTADKGVASASVGDDGNLALLNSSGSVVWQSFDFPTDTIVAGQRLRQGSSLTAGQYSASLQESGNLSLIYTDNGGYTYWSSDTAGANSSRSVYAELTGTNHEMFVINDEAGETLKSWYSNDYTVISAPLPVRRVTLGDDGNLRIHTTTTSLPRAWTIGWEALQDYCQIYAYCGPYGLCSYDAEGGRDCKCATQAGYARIDASNYRSGCRAIAGNGGENCNQSGVTMVELNNTVLFVSLNTGNTDFRYGDAACQQNCLLNNVCKAATALSDGSGSCRLVLSTTFFSGYQEPSVTTNSFFKFCGSNVPPPASVSSAAITGRRSSVQAVSVIVAVLVTITVLALGQVAMWWLCCRRNPRWGGYSAHYALLEYASGAPVQFTYKELRRATGNFKEKLGEGGFGTVYKGALPATSGGGGGTEVAVKRLEVELAEHGEKQFRMEVAVIGSTHHMNLVRLRGFCAEGRQRLLVYEYMRNGSLDKYLFGVEQAEAVVEPGGTELGLRRRGEMDWETRYSVLLGTARGITYLHQECRDRIIHSDIKPENILLDSTFTAKVSDFGMARLTRVAGQKGLGHVTTLLRGTRGYLAPEWRSNLPITVKADVFSFGMVVFETLTGRRSFDSDASSSHHVSFPEHAYRQFFLHNQVEGVIDERIRSNVDMEQFECAMKVAFWCMQVQPSMRPSMSKVVQMLDGSMQFIQTPPMPKSFGDHISDIINEEDLMGEGSPHPSSFAVASYGDSTYTATTSHSSISQSPKYSMSLSLIGHKDAHPPPMNVLKSF